MQVIFSWHRILRLVASAALAPRASFREPGRAFPKRASWECSGKVPDLLEALSGKVLWEE